MEGLSPLHLVLVLVIALLVLGPGKLPEVGAALGTSIREFRRATSDIEESVPLDVSPAQVPAEVLAPAATPAAAAAPLPTVEPGTAVGPTETAPPMITPTSAP